MTSSLRYLGLAALCALGAAPAAYGDTMSVLVTGGAGYIGSHTVVQLAAGERIELFEGAAVEG